MDILVSSNLERLLYLLSEGDCGYVAGLMEQLNREGHYQVSPQLLERLQAEFDCACCDDAGAAEVIRRLWRHHPTSSRRRCWGRWRAAATATSSP